MRSGWCILLVTWPSWSGAQHPLINEVLPSGAGADRVELYNPTSHRMDVNGWTLANAEQSQRIQGPLLIPPHGHLVLWCDRHPDKGADHVGFTLPREGGSLLLIAPDRRTVFDVLVWPALPAGVSYGPLHDGRSDLGYFALPTLGGPNQAGAERIMEAPRLFLRNGIVQGSANEGADVRVTRDGSLPNGTSPLLDPNEACVSGDVITARAFAANGIPSAPTSLTCACGAIGIAISGDPVDLFGDSLGVFSGSAGANFARRGKAWQRPVRVEWHAGDSSIMCAAQLSVSGSGTRSLPKKNVKLRAEGQVFSLHGSALSEVILRADGSPHAFLRNLFMEAIAGTGANVDVQPSTPLPLYLNGKYHGLYRAMPAKDAAWSRSLCGAEHVDVIDGPSGEVLSGDRVAHKELLRELARAAPLDSLVQLMEVGSLMDLACFDLWTGRADHDLNTRCWRPAERGGRWRWILFDMDLWAPTEEGTVQRMCSDNTLASPYLPQLLAHAELRPLLLARLSAWLATSLEPTRAEALTDSLYAMNENELLADQKRWEETMHTPEPKESLALLHAHIRERPKHLLEQLERYTHQDQRRVTVRVSPPEGGYVRVEGLPLQGAERSFMAFEEAPLHLRAEARAGYGFVGWKGSRDRSPEITVEPGKVKEVKAMFRLLDTSLN
jgi:CotH kinase protein